MPSPGHNQGESLSHSKVAKAPVNQHNHNFLLSGLNKKVKLLFSLANPVAQNLEKIYARFFSVMKLESSAHAQKLFSMQQTAHTMSSQ